MRRATEAARRDVPARSRPRAGPGIFEGTSGRRLVLALMAAYALVFTGLCAVKYRYFLYNDFDLAVFVQAVDGLLRGTMHGSIRGMNWLGDHSSLNLFLVAPLYAVFRSPLTLLTVQSVTLALGAVPVHATARRVLGDGLPAVAFAAAYLAFPALGYTNLDEFHPEVLSTTPLLFLFDAIHAGRPRAAMTWAFLALLGKEDVALVVMATALLLLVRGGPARRPLAAALAGLAAFFLVLTFGLLKPRFSGAEASYFDMYGQWGEGPRGVMLGILRHPLAALRALVDTPGDPVDGARKRWFFLHLLLPLGGLPLLAPLELVPALPILAEHLLSWRVPQHEIVWQYTALLTPSWVFAAIFGARNLSAGFARIEPARGASRTRRPSMAGAGFLLLASLASNLAFGALRPRGGLGVPPPRESFWPSAEDRTMARHRDAMLRELPARGSVVAGFEYLARLAHRDSVISAHHVLSGTFTFSRKAFPIPEGVSGVILDTAPVFSGDSSSARLAALVAINRLRPVDTRGNVLLFLADTRDSTEWLTRGVSADGSPQVVFDAGLAFVSAKLDSSRTAGGALTIRSTWRRVGPVEGVALTQLAVLDPGGHLTTTRPHVLGQLLHPVAGWPAGENVRETYRLMLGDDLAPGSYRIGLRVGWRDADGTVRDAVGDGDAGPVVDLGWCEVREREKR